MCLLPYCFIINILFKIHLYIISSPKLNALPPITSSKPKLIVCAAWLYCLTNKVEINEYIIYSMPRTGYYI